MTEVQKIAAVMSLIQQVYVEEPDLDKLAEGAIEGMLERLDPHSTYLPPSEQKAFAERDIGQFEGIGISFVIVNDLLTVVAPIPGTPADRQGIRAGDHIVEIDGESAIGITNEQVLRKLRGSKGTTVRVKVMREGFDEPVEFTLVRDAIPIYSLGAHFMVDDSTGYVLLNQFTATTSAELHQALIEMERAGMRRLLLDLRNNQGGRLQEAVEVLDMLIPEGYVLVSRKGRLKQEDSTYVSTGISTHPYFDLVVLVNGGSASASEIVASGVQDLDRGLIVGQPTFGKGLVQIPFPLKNGGVIRLSAAYWYAPSGRTVQKPFDKGRAEYYAASVKGGMDTTRLPTFKTLTGREVKGFSGVIPDTIIPERRLSSASAQLIASQLVFAYAQELANRIALPPEEDINSFLRRFQVTDEDLHRLLDRARAKNLTLTPEVVERDGDYLKVLIKAEVAQNLANSREHYYRVMVEEDAVVKAARSLFPRAREISAHWLSNWGNN